MRRRRIARSWDENDAYTGWRRYLRWQRGELAKIKRRTHRRERREGHQEITEQLDD